VLDLMAALQASVDQERAKGTGGRKPSSTTKTTKKRASRSKARKSA
jgi:hypothetical protein